MEKAKKKKILIGSVCAGLVALFAVTAVVLYFTVGIWLGDDRSPAIDFTLFDQSLVLTEEQVQADKDELARVTEDTHPYLALGMADGYDAAKRRLADAEARTAGDLYFAAAEYLAAFGDLHTETVWTVDDFLDFGALGPVRYIENDKWMFSPFGDQKDYELTAIGGVPLFDIYGKYAPQENENSAGRGLNYVMSAGYLHKAGIEWEDALTFGFKDADGNTVSADFPVAPFVPDTAGGGSAPKNFEAEVTDGDILYIAARSMTDDGSYGACIDQIKDAVKSGIKKAVIDVRGNGGGDDGFGLGIFDALGFTYSDMGFTIKYSEVTAKYRGTWHSSGYKTVVDFKYRSQNKNGIDLKVFCNEGTGSAAMAVVSQCRYSDLGEVIGRTPGQNTNFCGNVTYFQLANSKVNYRLPLTYGFYERNGQTAPDRLAVDVEVPARADYMDYVKWGG